MKLPLWLRIVAELIGAMILAMLIVIAGSIVASWCAFCFALLTAIKESTKNWHGAWQFLSLVGWAIFSLSPLSLVFRLKPETKEISNEKQS